MRRDAADAESIKASSQRNKMTEELVAPSSQPSAALPRDQESHSKHKEQTCEQEQMRTNKTERLHYPHKKELID